MKIQIVKNNGTIKNIEIETYTELNELLRIYLPYGSFKTRGFCSDIYQCFLNKIETAIIVDFELPN
jgi:hypothetical protein